MLRIYFLTIALCSLALFSHAQNAALAQMHYEDAVKAYNDQEYHRGLELLQKAEVELGRANSPVLMQRIRIRDRMLAQGNNRTMGLVSELLTDCDRYIGQFTEARYKDLVREVLQVQNKARAERDALEREEAARLAAAKAAEERAAMAALQERMEALRVAIERNSENDVRMALALGEYLDHDLSSSDPALIYAVKQDALGPFIIIRTDMQEHHADRFPERHLLATAIRADAVSILRHLAGTADLTSFTSLDEQGRGILELAVNSRARNVLSMYHERGHDLGALPQFTRNDAQLAGFWSSILLEMALQEDDPALVELAISTQTPAEGIGTLVFRSMEANAGHAFAKLLTMAPPKVRNEKGQSFLHKAIALDRPDMALALLETGHEDKSPDGEGLPACHYLITRTPTKVLADRNVLERLDLNVLDPNGTGILHKAIFKDAAAAPAEGHASVAAIIEILLAANRSLNVNLPSVYGWTPLHYAVRENRGQYVRVLLEHGADKNVRDQWGRSPRSIAEERNFGQLLTVL